MGMKSFKSGDRLLLVIGVVLLLALTVHYWNGAVFGSRQDDHLTAVITRNGSKVAEIDLSKIKEPQYFQFDEGIHTVILAEEGYIKFLEADCPDKICVKTGTLKKPGDQAVCMPGKTIVRILDN